MNTCEGAIPDVADLVVGLAPIDLSAAARNGRWFNMKDAKGVNAILISAIGTAGDDPVITFEQAQDASGTGAKELTIRRVDEKIGGTGFTSSNDLWTRVSSINRDNPAASRTNATSAENEAVQSFFFLATDLDVQNNFTHLRLKVADVGANAQLGCIVYIPSSRGYQGKQNVSALA